VERLGKQSKRRRSTHGVIKTIFAGSTPCSEAKLFRIAQEITTR
jgi:hypothetical protein